MRKLAWLFPLILPACSSAPEVRRLTPVPVSYKTPSECRLISVLADSPAGKAGLNVGDRLVKINDKVPADAWDAGELVNASGDVMAVEVAADSAPLRSVQVTLNKSRPRLGAACDLTGFRRHGVTAAGNESQTNFEGPYALTASGIVDKALIFIRLRLANNEASDLSVTLSQFTVKDSAGNTLPILTPKEVICDLFGDRGARLLSLKVRRRESVDFTTLASSPDETCGSSPVKGRLKTTDASYVESNAEYLARESLWPVTLKPGQTADGVIYLAETPSLPVRISTRIGERDLSVSLGGKTVQPVVPDMKSGDVLEMLKTMKKGTPLRVTLKKNRRVFVGRFSSYDALEEVAWFNSPTGGLLGVSRFPLRTILSIQPVEPTNN